MTSRMGPSAAVTQGSAASSALSSARSAPCPWAGEKACADSLQRPCDVWHGEDIDGDDDDDDDDDADDDDHDDAVVRLLRWRLRWRRR